MESYNVLINLQIKDHEVPELRETEDYPALFDHCLFWAGLRDKNNSLIAFGCMVGPGIEHGYLEDIIVHSSYQGKGIGNALVKRLLQEAELRGISIVTVTFEEANCNFYEKCGFSSCPGGVWRKNE